MIIKDIQELVIDKWREVLLLNTIDGKIEIRLTQIESPKIDLGAEADDVNDADGTKIYSLYKAKTATVAFDNAFWSLNLAAAQAGGKKKVASAEDKIVTPVTKIGTIGSDATVELDHLPVGTIKYVYKLVNRGIAEAFTLSTGETVEEGTFKIKDKTITLPQGTTGTLYVRYEYESDNAVQLDVSSEEFPDQTAFEAHVRFRDPCNKNNKIDGVIIADKAEFDPTSISWDFAKGGKHSVTLNITKDYCNEIDANLFSIILAE